MEAGGHSYRYDNFNRNDSTLPLDNPFFMEIDLADIRSLMNPTPIDSAYVGRIL